MNSKKANAANSKSAYGGYNKGASDLKFRVTESYKTLRTNIIFSLMKKGCKRIVISSANVHEGKSTVSVNVAISIAQTDARVLLIDGDLRKPTVHRFFGLQNVPGLTNYLGGMSPMEEVLHDTKYPNLKVICSGVSVPNPSEILASEQMQELMESFEDQYDYVIIDTPPINVVSDALPLIKRSDGVIFVVREGQSTFTEIDKALKNLELINAKVLGMILNGEGSSSRRYKEYSKYSKYSRYEQKS